MKTFSVILTSLALLASCQAGISISFSSGNNDRGDHHPDYRHSNYHHHEESTYVVRPPPSRCLPTPPPAVSFYYQSTPAPTIPSGFFVNGYIQSPWSTYALPVYGRYRGQVLYDPFAHRSFLVP